jgi:hypothetical protein
VVLSGSLLAVGYGLTFEAQRNTMCLGCLIAVGLPFVYWWAGWECGTGCKDQVSLVLSCCVLVAAAYVTRTSLCDAVAAQSRQTKVCLVCILLCVTFMGLRWEGKTTVATLMSCGMLLPLLYACRILWTEWAAEKRRKKAVGEPTPRQQDDAAHGSRPAASSTTQTQVNVAADEALLASVFPDGQHTESIRAAGHLGRLACVTEPELERAGLSVEDRRALMGALREDDPTTHNPLLAGP